MSLIEASLRFPTVVFTIGLGIALVYWLFVLLGAIDIDLFHGNADFDVAAAGKGVGDALVGGAKGGAEALKGVKPGADAEGGVWAGLGLSKVPITISISVIFLVCWVLSLLAMSYLPGFVGGGSWVAPVVLPATLIAGLPLAGLLVRPLGGVFEVHEGKSNQDYIGHTCTIKIGHDGNGIGQATVEDGGTVLLIAVRCDRPGGLERNDKALIIEFDAARRVYLVEPVADILPAARETEPGETA